MKTDMPIFVFVYAGPELYRRGDSAEAFDYSCMKLGDFRKGAEVDPSEEPPSLPGSDV